METKCYEKLEDLVEEIVKNEFMEVGIDKGESILLANLAAKNFILKFKTDISQVKKTIGKNV